MPNFFESPFKGTPLQEQVTNPNIIVGKHSYYSGYYHGHSFDECARYLRSDEETQDKLIIGAYCSIGSGAAFMMAGNQGHRPEWATTFPFHYFDEPAFEGAHDGFKPAGSTCVGNDVWIGSEAMIMPGVQIGNGALIGSRAVVTKNVPAYAVVAGNPATVVRSRFSEEQVQMLLEMKWWDWTDEVLKGAMPLMCSSDIERLYDYWLGF
ncbi:Chloramphenicol acetyltransferase [Pseudovibrio sp. W64]|uniref:type B chloramphenicol O-acetyltransferase n=1 Tax=unclassified Pseudovibrio TaxID=2627060 RepID=UPI0007AEA0B4|nr:MULTISPECIES: type B chloramphenicol O-acetyltransferase [unclassified Pseudovibrio]KZK79867.1 Chloramphenicol acetyltransferase [Pseudovibrio sp. Ad13]KZK88323.1 Chloramphenicol acetyltransferase [Pseudovibrio sp. W64]